MVRQRFFNTAMSPETPVIELQRLYAMLLKLKENDRDERKCAAQVSDDQASTLPDLSPETVRALEMIHSPANKPA